MSGLELQKRIKSAFLILLMTPKPSEDCQRHADSIPLTENPQFARLWGSIRDADSITAVACYGGGLYGDG